jgi:hypothetical protein
MNICLISSMSLLLGFIQVVDVFYWSLGILAILVAGWMLLLAAQKLRGWYTEKRYKIIKIRSL